MCNNTPKMCRNDVESGQKNSGLYNSVLVMLTETLGKVTHLVYSQSGSKCAKIHQKCAKMVLNLI